MAAWLAGLIFLLFALFIRLQQGTWYAPGAFFSICWSLFVFIPLLTIQEFAVPLSAVLWIIASAVMVYIGSVIGSGKGMSRLVPVAPKDITKRKQHDEAYNLKLPWLIKITFACTLLGLLTVAILVWSTGRGISVFTSLSSLTEMAQEIFGTRYGSGYTEPTWVIVLNTFNYVGALLGGVLFATSKSLRPRLVALLPLATTSILGFSLVARTGIIIAVVLWLSSYLATRVLASRGTKSIPIRLPLVIIALALLAAVGTQVIRYGLIDFSSESLAELGTKWHDTFAYLPAFSEWFADHWQDSTPLALGAATFGRVYMKIGIADLRTFDAVPIGTTSTNLFTIYRELIEDFSPIGSLLCFLLLGLLAGFAFKQVVKGKSAYLSLLVGFYCYVLFSQTRSIFSYTVIVIAWLTFTFYLLFAESRKDKHQYHEPNP